MHQKKKRLFLAHLYIQNKSLQFVFERKLIANNFHLYYVFDLHNF